MSEPHDPISPPPDDDRGGAMQHLVKRGVPLVVLLVGLVGAYLYWGRDDHDPKAHAAAGPGGAAPALPVNVVTTEAATVPLRPRFLGQTEASQVVEIRSRVRGFLLERAFDEGQAVKAGQVLFRIDPKPFQADLDVARAALNSAKATHERAVTELKRYETLFAQKNVTANELDEVQKQERVADAMVQSAVARAARAELDLGYTTVVSPINGMIDRSLKDVGSYLDDSTNSLLTTVRQVEPMYVRYAVSEQELLRWQRQRESGEITVPDVKQLELEVTLGDGRPYPHHGRINFVDVRVDPQTGTAVIRGTVPNPENTLLPGQFIHASVLGIERLNTIMVPQKSVVQAPSGPTVYVVNDKNLVEQRPVTLGDWVEQGWVVEKGLKAGERVVVDRLTQVRPGAAVTAVAATPAPATRPVAAARQ
jgi:membrane fusion protein (multidrug efflux system)